MKFLPFEEARTIVQRFELKGVKEWQEWRKSGQRPANIPSSPERTYRGKGWVSYMDWLGFEGKAGAKKGDYLPYETARALVRGHNLKSKTEWEEWRKSGQRPANIPSTPYKVYRDKGWVSWMDWLGTDNIRGGSKKGDYLPYETARDLVRGHNLKGQKEWWEWSKGGQRPANIPSHPDEVYRGKGWVSWMDWLGNENKNTSSSENEIILGNYCKILNENIMCGYISEQYKITFQNGKYCRPDIYSPETKTCIEYDGCWWHGCNKCKRFEKNRDIKYNGTTLNKRRKNTINKKKTLKDNGYNIITVKECEWENHKDIVMFILKRLRKMEIW